MKRGQIGKRVIILITAIILLNVCGIAQNACNLSLIANPAGASCSNACDGSVVLTPSGGTAPYSFNAFEHNFPGSTVDLSLFDVRNGNFTVSGNQLIAKANNSLATDYDNSVTTKTAFIDNGKIVVEGSFYIDYNTYGNFGLAENDVIVDQAQLPYSFFFSYGILYVMNEGNLIQIGNYSSSTWYDLKIEKIGTTVNYYTRSTGLASYSLVTTTTASQATGNFKLCALYNNFLNFYGGFKTTNWRVGGNPPTSGLCPGTYNYTVFDANGCYATASVTLGVTPGPNSLTLNGSATSASCASAADGTTTLLPSGGTGPYSYGFTHYFQGGSINQNIFELRNGNFSQGSDLREGTNYNNNNSWDNSVSTRTTFSDGGYLLFEGSFKFDANADVIFGFTNTGVIDDYSDVLMGFRVANGTQLYAYSNNGGLVLLPSILFDTWYDFKIEKTGNTVKYYSRLANTGSYILRHSRTYSSARVEYKAGALNFASFYASNGGYNTKSWNIQSVPKTAELLPGTYTYTITDANGCSATKVLNVIADIDNVVSLNATLVSGACGNASNGAVALTPIAGKPPYSYAFTQNFSGSSIQAGLFEVRNGSFVQDGGSLRGEVIPTTTQWDNSVATYYTFTDAAKLSFEGSLKFDANSNVYFGFLNNTAIINDPSQVQIGYFINGTQLYVRAGGSNVLVGSINTDTWYDFKIEKQENVVRFYNRVNGNNSYTLLTTIPYAGVETIFRFGVLMYGSAGNYGGFNTKNWLINDNPPTTGLAAGTYTYKVYDAPGCYASATIVVPSNNNFTVSANTTNTSAWNVCDGGVTISSNSGGNLSSVSRLYNNSFTGTSFNNAGFVIRNGAFSQNNALLQANLLNNSGWDNSIGTQQTFNDNGTIIGEMEMQFSSATEVYYGLADASHVLNGGAAMTAAFKYVSGNLYAFVGGNATLIGNVNPGQWNSYKVEKTGNSVKFYIRPVQDNQYQLLYTASIASPVTIFRLGIVNYYTNTAGDRSYRSRNWNVYNAALTSGMCAGTYTYVISEASGCSADITFAIGTNLALVQTMTAPANVVANTNLNAAFASGINLGNPGFAAAPTGITITNNAPAVYPVGITIVTWTAVDANGLVVTGNQTVTVIDNQPPVISAPANVTVTLYGGQTIATGVSLGTATATDNVPGVTISNDAPASFPVGTTVVTWTATDASGNTTTANQTVTVISVELPVITAPADVSVVTDVNQAFATNVSLGTPSLSNYNVPGITIINNAPTVFPVGTTYVTWTVSDNFGNSNSSIQTVVVTDVQPPAITAPANITVSTDWNQSFATGVNLGTASANDNVAGLTVTNNAPASFSLGSTTVTWTATDASGNTATATQTITVIDNQPPTIAAPANITVSTDWNQSFATGVNLGTASANDNVAGVTVTNNAPAVFPIGSTTVTWIATDAAGFTATATQVVTVTDNQPPTISAPANVNVTIAANQTSATGVSLGSATAVDNVPGVTVSNNALVNYPIGTTTVTWIATDAAGNTSSATQLVTVTVMSTPPVANCRPVTVSLVNGMATISPADVNNGSNAAGGIASMSLNKTSFTCSDIGTNTVTLTVTDNGGLSSTCTATITVIGEVPGVVSVISTPTTNTYTGGVSTNLYLGYGAQSTQLKVNAPLSGAPYTYFWNGQNLSSDTSAMPVFTPVTAGVYTFTVKLINKYGCSSIGTITICVKDIRDAASKGKKVFICHIPPGNPSNSRVLSVSINAVEAHLQHGDQLGSCNQVCGTTAKGVVEANEAPFAVEVSPNPTSGSFVLQVRSADVESAINVRVIDAFGRTIQKQTIGEGSPFRFGGNYTNGTYYAEVIQGNERKVIKLMKL